MNDTNVFVYVQNSYELTKFSFSSHSNFSFPGHLLDEFEFQSVMATKKDRKTMKRDGVVTTGVDIHKHAELEACQRLLEAGAIGARLYSGPSITGAFQTRQDMLLREVKWTAVDLYEQRKIAVAQCRVIADMVNKYWSERSRGSLSSAASMVQNYWMSVAKEIRAPIPSNFKQSHAWTQGSLFKLNTLQSSFRTMSATGGSGSTSPRSTNPLPTPTATSHANIDEQGIDGQSVAGHGSVTNKRALGHGLAHDWLDEREQVNPPLADSTTGLADFSVQIVKHHLRESQKSGSSTPSRNASGRQQHISPEQHSRQLQLELSSPSFEDDSPKGETQGEKGPGDALTPHAPPFNHKLYSDIFIPVDDFIGTDREVSAIDHAINLALSKYGGVTAMKASSTHASGTRRNVVANFASQGLDKQRTVLEEILATNIMSRSPQLFSLAASLAAASVEIPPTTGQPGRAGTAALFRVGRRVNGQSAAGAADDTSSPAAIVHKHYFVSVIYSTFNPIPSDSVEDTFLQNFIPSLSTNNIDWDLVADAVNWRMKAWVGYDNIRTGSQCQARFPQLSGGHSDLSSPPSKKKQRTVSVSVSISRNSRKANRMYKIQASSSKSSVVSPIGSGEVVIKANPFRNQGPQPVTRFAVPLDKRGVYSSSRPVSNSHSRQFFHEPRAARDMTLVLRGSTSSSRDPLVHVFSTVSVMPHQQKINSDLKMLEVLSASVRGTSKQISGSFHNSLVDQARQEALEYSKAIALKVMTSRNRSDPPRRAFGVEEMLRKNPNVVASSNDQYVSGGAICPTHPSFSNMPRIAEITIGRLLNSLAPEVPPSNTTPAVPLNVGTLFNYCAAFRKKYPAIFVSQQKTQKPAMPQLRPGFMMSSGQGNKMVTRQAAAAAAAAVQRPVQHMAPQQLQVSNQPRQHQPTQIVLKQQQPPPPPVSVPETPDPVGVTPITAAALPSAAWIRSSQRSRRSGANSQHHTRGTNSPTNEKSQAGEDPNKMMAAGGPSLYGFHTRTSRGNR